MGEIKKIKLKRKVIEVEICNTIFSRARGLMFRKKSKPLLFVFNKPTRQSIHSFFCKPFKAVWLNKNKIIEEKTVKPFSLNVKPSKCFTEIVEIPLNNNNKFSKLPTGK